MIKTSQPDIVVTSQDGEYLMLVEVKVKDISIGAQNAIEQLKHTMASIGCSVGLIVAGERVILLRDSLEKYNGESIYVVGEAKLPDSLLPPADEQWKGHPGIEFESRVQRWLEKLKLTASMDNFPSDLRNLLGESIIILLRIGEVRAGGPKMEQGCTVKPKAVLVETNWVVDVVAPAYLQNPQAIQLLQRAQAGEFKLYVPAICLAEARETVPRRFAPRSRSDDLRKFIKWARDEARVNSEDADAAYRVFAQFDGLVANELTKVKVSERLDELAKHLSLNVFPLSEPMLERQIFIGAMDISLKPFDLAVLAAVIVKSEELQQEGYPWVGFCELDSDLQPWDKSGARKPVLSDLYDDARILVYADFLLEDISELPDGWTTST